MVGNTLTHFAESGKWSQRTSRTDVPRLSDRFPIRVAGTVKMTVYVELLSRATNGVTHHNENRTPVQREPYTCATRTVHLCNENRTPVQREPYTCATRTVHSIPARGCWNSFPGGRHERTVARAVGGCRVGNGRREPDGCHTDHSSDRWSRLDTQERLADQRYVR
jgi:hypothetical protein